MYVSVMHGILEVKISADFILIDRCIDLTIYSMAEILKAYNKVKQ